MLSEAVTGAVLVAVEAVPRAEQLKAQLLSMYSGLLTHWPSPAQAGQESLLSAAAARARAGAGAGAVAGAEVEGVGVGKPAVKQGL